MAEYATSGGSITLQRGSTANVHSGGDIITTNVDISALGITDITKVKEILLGATCSLGGYVAAPRIRITSTTNLEVVTRTGFSANTITVYWRIDRASVKVQRGLASLSITNAAAPTLVATTISAVGSLSAAKEYLNGFYVTPSTNSLDARIELTSTTNLNVYAEGSVTGTVSLAWLVDG